jgi:hypothetical protein
MVDNGIISAIDGLKIELNSESVLDVSIRVSLP